MVLASTDYFFWALKQVAKLPFEQQWLFLIVRLPWLVPTSASRFLTGAPHPFTALLASRGTGEGKPAVGVHIFLPPAEKFPIPKNGYPINIDFHGGGFTMGSCLEQAPFCSLLARERGIIVVTVDYRMGPLWQFPDALHDGEDVLNAAIDATSLAGMQLRKAISHKLSKRITQHPSSPLIDPSLISLSGFSSGGNIALNLALSISTPELTWPSPLPITGPPIPLLLFFPSFDQTLLPHERAPPNQTPPVKDPKHDKSSFGYKLSSILGPTYLPQSVRSHLRSNPGSIDVVGLNPRCHILLVLPEIDSLAEQSAAWVQKMTEGGRGEGRGLSVERCVGMQHGWTQFPDAVLGKKAKKEKWRVFRRAVGFMGDAWADEGKTRRLDEGDTKGGADSQSSSESR